MSQDPEAQDANADAARMIVDLSSDSVPAVSDFASNAISSMSSAELQASHHKRLAQILRYLATIHRGGGSSGGNSLAEHFIREYQSVNVAKEAIMQEFDMTGQSADPVEIGDSPLLFFPR